MKLRPYQQEIISRVIKLFNAGKRRMLIMAPTGSGKTFIASELIKQARRAVFITHRRDLCAQSQNAFIYAGINAAVFAAEKRDTDQCTVAMLQTISRHTEPLADASLVIVDEVHYGWDSLMLSEVLEATPDTTTVIGLSATPINRKGHLLPGFDAIIDICQVQELVKQGFLVAPRIVAPLSPDLSRVRLIAGDYSTPDLDKVMRASALAHDVVASWQRHAKNYKTVAYCTTTEHADELAAQFQAAGINAESYHSKRDDDYRAGVLGRFSLGMTQVITNVDMLTVGWDDPSVQCILLARPTKSEGYYLQIVGRGMRPAKGKLDWLLLDCAGCVEENGMPTSERHWRFAPLIGNVADRAVGLDRENEVTDAARAETLPEPLTLRLREISSLSDLYEGKSYRLEAELMKDCRKILDRWGRFYWRQNSGVMREVDERGRVRWVNFTSVKGLPDISLFVGPVYVGLELKPKGKRYTDNQKETLPRMVSEGMCVRTIEHPCQLAAVLVEIEQAVKRDGDTLTVDMSVLRQVDERTAKLIKEAKC